jgi:hypothetical protein
LKSAMLCHALIWALPSGWCECTMAQLCDFGQLGARDSGRLGRWLNW